MTSARVVAVESSLVFEGGCRHDLEHELRGRSGRVPPNTSTTAIVNRQSTTAKLISMVHADLVFLFCPRVLDPEKKLLIACLAAWRYRHWDLTSSSLSGQTERIRHHNVT